MSKDSSFDIVSEIDLQIVDNALHTSLKEIQARYDFKDSKASVVRTENIIELRAEDDYKLEAMGQIFRQKAIKQGIDLKFFDFGEKSEALGGMLKQPLTIKKGISKEKAKDINLFIKELNVKTNSQIQGDIIRVSSKDKDNLQKVIAGLRGHDFGIALSFTNYR
jgi:cyclic-di-GMP-binding protein